MILWTGKTHTETEIQFAAVGRRSWRWVLEIENYCAQFALDVKFKGLGDRWLRRGRYYAVSLTRHFGFGMDHVYYDGYNHSFSLEFLHFAWLGRRFCQKCEDEK